MGAIKGLQASMKVLGGSETGGDGAQQAREGYHGNNPHVGCGPTWAAAGAPAQGAGAWRQRQTQPYATAPDANQAFCRLPNEEFQRLLQESLADEGNDASWPLSPQQQASALRAEAAHEVDRILSAESSSEALGGGSAGQQNREFRRLV